MGSRLTTNGADKVYAATLRWVHHALQSDGSLFTPGAEIWSSELLEQVRRSGLDNPNIGSGNFLDKLCQQLTQSQSPPEICQLMAEALYIYYIASSARYNTKTNNINRLLELSEQPEIPANLRESLSRRIASFDDGRGQVRISVSFIIEFAKQWKERSDSDRAEMLIDPWAFKDFAKDFSPTLMREALLHLVHSDAFEAIVDIAVKEKIVAGFPDAAKDPTDDIDRKLHQIRANLERQLGEHNNLFYKPVIRNHWDKRVSNCLQ